MKKYYYTKIKGQDGVIYTVLCELKRAYLMGLRVELAPIPGLDPIALKNVRRWRMQCRPMKDSV